MTLDDTEVSVLIENYLNQYIAGHKPGWVMPDIQIASWNQIRSKNYDK